MFLLGDRQAEQRENLWEEGFLFCFVRSKTHSDICFLHYEGPNWMGVGGEVGGGRGSTCRLSVYVKFNYFVGCRLKFSTFVGCR